MIGKLQHVQQISLNTLFSENNILNAYLVSRTYP